MNNWINLPGLDQDEIQIISKACRRYNREDIPLQDSEYVGEAYLGIIDAKELYDPTRGTKFSTFAYPRACWRASDLYRSKRVARRGEGRNVQLTSSTDACSDESVVDEVIRREKIEVVKEIVREVLTKVSSDKKRQIFKMVFEDEYTHAQAASVIGVTKQRVQKVYSEMLDMFTALFTERYGREAF